MANEHPGHRSFFKYASPDAARATLMNRTVRYSSPLKFNDPFDIQTGLHFDFDPQKLHGKLVDYLDAFASSPTAPEVDKQDPWGEMALQFRNSYPTLGFDKHRWRKLTEDSFNKDLLPVIKNTQVEYSAYWKNALPRMRVFCVSEERDNLLMWAHYAKDHTGVVFEFLSLPEIDSTLSILQKVEYSISPPTFFTEQEWLDDLLTIKRFNLSILRNRFILNKSKEWEYEKEWRIWYPDSNTEDGHDYIPISQQELPKMFIGCRADTKFKKEIITLAREGFPNIQIYQASARADKYSLEYREI